MNIDSPSYYTEEELKKWADEFLKPENSTKFFLPGIPFSYPEIVRELRRIDNIKGATEL